MQNLSISLIDFDRRSHTDVQFDGEKERYNYDSYDEKVGDRGWQTNRENGVDFMNN